MFSLSRAFNNSISNKVIVETEIAGLRGAVGQYNVIPTLLYKSVAPMHKSGMSTIVRKINFNSHYYYGKVVLR